MRTVLVGALNGINVKKREYTIEVRKIYDKDMLETI